MPKLMLYHVSIQSYHKLCQLIPSIVSMYICSSSTQSYDHVYEIRWVERGVDSIYVTVAI